MEENNKSSFAISALVLGIISVLASGFWYITLPSAILAVVLGVKANNKNGSKMGKAGLILGIIGLALFVFIYAFTIMVLMKNY